MPGGSRNRARARTFRAVVIILATIAAAMLAGRLAGTSTAGRLGQRAGERAERSTVSAGGAAGSRDVPAPTVSASETVIAHSLAGSTAPRLPFDARGHLAKTRAVREFFDYFLTTRHEVAPEALDAMVRQQIAAQVDGRDAQSEALDLWQRYRAYLAALAQIAALQARSREGGSALDVDALQAVFDARASLASRMLGASWSEAFFGREWRETAYSLARLRIMGDKTLTDAQKAARLDALAETLPPDERALLEREAKAQAAVGTIAALTREDRSPDELRAQATQALGVEVAERVVQMRRQDDAWRARYADYTAQRAQIDAMGLSQGEREVRVAQLRERIFSDPGERVRAAALDAGPAQ